MQTTEAKIGVEYMSYKMNKAAFTNHERWASIGTMNEAAITKRVQWAPIGKHFMHIRTQQL